LTGKDLYGIFKHLWNPIELLPKPGVAGSIPAGGTIFIMVNLMRRAGEISRPKIIMNLIYAKLAVTLNVVQ